MKHCPTCRCDRPRPEPLVINMDAPFYGLVLLIDRYAHRPSGRPR